MITVTSKGDFKKTHKFLASVSKKHIRRILEKYGQEGVVALIDATPYTTGETAASWDYEVHETPTGYSITWTNSHVVNGVNIAIILQYGHATGTGGYVRGVDYINPALKPIFDQIADKVWKEVNDS